ncbi:hypothetical protein QBC46DRAFT_398440 [Diplogelasinospora grovesii]|uniref:Uncharacterized protein n=1 Tax=Diplogelasinospora grovesii TaxID=303347 RepID=A0AAN6MXR7_9PEZI|nr:hypothetical protein QBC46DRAFT_398440 [Diplogelasinospora grovesii]
MAHRHEFEFVHIHEPRERGRDYDRHMRGAVSHVEGGAGGLDRGGMGDYVTRRLIPAMQSRSDRPIKVVMNYGKLCIDEAAESSGRGIGGGSSNRTGAANAIIYNAPGSSMAVGGGGGGGSGSSLQSRSRPRVRGVSPADARRAARDHASYDYVPHRHQVSACLGCLNPRRVNSAGYCVECDMFITTPPSADYDREILISSREKPRERERYSGFPKRDRDGVRYVGVETTPIDDYFPSRREREREKERERARERELARRELLREREREREKIYSAGYYSDSEAGFY